MPLLNLTVDEEGIVRVHGPRDQGIAFEDPVTLERLINLCILASRDALGPL